MGAISSFSRSLIRKPEDSIYTPTKYMNDFFQCTKYIPVHWKNNFHTHDVRDEFIKLFPYKLLLLLYDLVSVITTPFILILYLTKDSNEIFNFIKNNTMKIKKVGNVCTYAYLQNFNENAMNNSIILYKENNEIENNNTYYDDDDDYYDGENNDDFFHNI
jgi:autophagy-related protein 9